MRPHEPEEVPCHMAELNKLAGGLSEGFKTLLGMPQNFLECDREQPFWMSPDPRDWLPEGHLAWFVLESVEQMDLASFYGATGRLSS
jgi:hypothetical protein